MYRPIHISNLALSHRFEIQNTAEDLTQEVNTMTLARRFAIGSIEAYTARIIIPLKNRCNLLRLINRFPNEVLAHIFQFVEGDCGNTLRPLNARAPLNLSRVSNLWREIALSISTLWTKIDVMNVPILPIRSMFIERSKNAPLHITILPEIAIISPRTKWGK